MASGVFSSLIWKFLNGGTAQVIQLIVSIVVARMLAPADFGVVSLLLVFTSISTVFIQAGLGSAIIQKKDLTQIQLSSVFCYSFFSAILLYFLLYITAPLIEIFYKIENLSTYMRVLALVLIFGSFNAIQNALIAKQMLWKQQCICNIISVLLSGLIGIVFAYYKFGAWAIIYQQLSFSIITCISLFFVVRWIPSFRFSYKESKSLFKYGLNLLGANLIDTIFHNLENLIIAKKFTPATLAFFTKGRMFPYILVTNIDGSLQSVMLPVFSKRQDRIEELKSIIRKTISTSSFILVGILMTLLLCAEPMITILLGNKWLDAVPFTQMYCLIGLLIPLETSSSQAINAIGMSKIYFKIMSIKRTLGVLLLILATVLFQDVFAIVYAALLVEIIAVFIHTYYNFKILKYSPLEFVCDIYKNIIGGMSILILYLIYKNILPQNPYVSIIMIATLSLITYVVILYLLKSTDLKYMIEKIRSLHR